MNTSQQPVALREATGAGGVEPLRKREDPAGVTKVNTTQRDALYLAEHLEKFRSFPEDIAAAAELRRQHARIEQLEKSESDLITERDYRDDIIDRMADAVLGTDRAEWSSSYDLIDAAQEVEDFMEQVEVTNAKVEKLKAEVEKLQQQLIAEAKKVAEEKLRADQLDKQHTMQARLHTEANQKIVEAARQNLKENL